MKATLILIIAILITIGSLTDCSKPYELEKCNWVYASYQDLDNPDSLIKKLYIIDYAFCCDLEDYSDTILCHKLWVKKTGTTETIRYFTNSTTSYTVLKQWKVLNYQTK